MNTQPKWTPGPWLVNEGNGRVHTPVDESDTCVARCAGDHFDPPFAECLANAHLIAAAPELIQAIEYALTYVMPPTVRICFDAALRKARGEG